MSETILIPLSKTGKHAGKYFAVVDDCDAEYVLQFNWGVRVSRNTNYARRFTGTHPTRNVIAMHRVILGRKLGRELLSTEICDHINGNGLDNRRENLRLSTHAQNLQNRGRQHNGVSGYKGAHWRSDTQKWASQITVNGKRIHLGSFDTPEQAHEAYCAKAKELHGEYANFGRDK